MATKKLFFLFSILLSMVGTKARAYDIAVENADGVTIYYNFINDGTELEVTSVSGSICSVVIPEEVTYRNKTRKVTSIGVEAFYYCRGLTSVTIPNSVTSIGKQAFSGCEGLTSITIPNSVTNIGGFAFSGCSGLTSVTIPNSVTSIGYDAFYGCSGLTFMIVEEGNPKYDSRDNCNAIIETATNTLIVGCKKSVIPNSVTSIGMEAFRNCSGLTSVTIPNSVTSIGMEAFRYCSGLTSVTFGNSVTSIGEHAFSGTPWYDNQPDGVVYAGKVLYKYKGTMPVGTSISIEKGTLGIASAAFRDCKGLKSITIPNSVTSIGMEAFRYCSGLTYITIPNSVTSIGEYAFYGCSGLTSVTIPNSVTSIGSSTFCSCSGLTSVTIPNSVTSIGDYAFSGCSGLTSVTIPNSVTSIGYDAFSGCSGLTSVTIPNSVTSIGDYAFSYCSRLTSITIPNSVRSIGNGAFSGCSGLTSVTIPNSVTSIGGFAFYNCSGLTSVTIPNSVTSIGIEAFSGTPWYDNQPDGVVYAGKVLYKYKGTMPEGTSISIEEGTLGIASAAFRDCKGLKSITIPNSVTSIGYDAFSGCSGLTSVTIPNSVTSIGSSAFYGCSGLTSVTIPNSVTSIGLQAFYLCDLTEVISGIENPFVIAANTFSNKTFGNATLYIPAGTIDKYKATVGWKKFVNIEEQAGSAISINKSETIIEKGKTETLTATISPTALDQSVTWKSSNTKVATVSSSGKVKGVKAGKATITCTSVATGMSAFCEVTVSYVKLDQTELIVEKTKTATLTATVYPSSLTDKSVTWKSSNTKVATVSSKGKVKGVKAGKATITCTSVATGLSTTCKVTVGYVKLDQTEAIVEKGKTVTLKPTVYPSSLEDKSVTWTSSDTKVATVSSSGKVKGVKYGTATITCTSVATGLSTTCQVTVGKVVVSISEVSIKKSRGITLEATVYPSSLTDKSVIWESSNTEIATVTSSGRVKGIKAGTATITCTSVATGLKGTCTVTVLSTSESRSLEGDDDEVTGIKNLDEAIEPFDVYDLSGQKVLNQVTSLDGLPAGIYIVNGKKVMKKK